MMIYFMLSGALRSAGDAKTPMVLGIVMTVLNVFLNIILISGFGPIPAFGTKGAAIGTCIASGLIGVYSFWKLWNGSWVVTIRNKNGYAPDFNVIRRLFKFGLPAGFQGIAMNVGGVLLLAFIGSLAESAAAQAAYAVSYTQLIFACYVDFGWSDGSSGGGCGTKSRCRTTRTSECRRAYSRPFRSLGRSICRLFLFLFPASITGEFSVWTNPIAVEIGVQLLRVLSISGVFVSVALTYTGGLQGTGDTKSPLYISIISQVIIPLGICFIVQQTIGLEAVAYLVRNSCRTFHAMCS